MTAATPITIPKPLSTDVIMWRRKARSAVLKTR